MFCNRFLRRFLDTVQKPHEVSISVVPQTALEKIPVTAVRSLPYGTECHRGSSQPFRWTSGKLGDWKAGVSGSGWMESRDAASILHPQRVCHDKVALGRRASS